MATKIWHRLLFDQADYKLLTELDKLIDRPRSGKSVRKLFEACFHPRGIKELAAPKELRIVAAMYNLLDTFEQGGEAMEQRLAALQALHDEVITGIGGRFRHNTARVLLQLMKELIRERTDQVRRLKLAHELRRALLGQPRFIRRLLKRYYLLEMPESWTQLAFDSHVHDANTKGRKAPTHLIMDAWIKGIRQLQVVYYNYVPRHAADELLQAAAIMAVDVRIGVEFSTVYRNRFVEMIWTPFGFSGASDFLRLLDRPRVVAFTNRCLAAAAYRKKLVLKTLDDFNRQNLKKLNDHFHIRLHAVGDAELLASIRYGQPALEHIAELLAARVRQALDERFSRLEGIADGEMERERREITDLRREVTAEYIREHFIDGRRLSRPQENLRELPEINRYSQLELIEELRRISPGCRITLNLSNLKLEDVVEILFDCRGQITHLEIFNLKDMVLGGRTDDAAINEFRQALNGGDAFGIKQMIVEVLRRLKESKYPDKLERIGRLREILHRLVEYVELYSHAALGARLGSDSASRSSRVHGMGLVVLDSLPKKVRTSLCAAREGRESLQPVRSLVYRQCDYLPDLGRLPVLQRPLFGFLQQHCGCFFQRQERWIFQDNVLELGDASAGNLVALGGFYQSELSEHHALQELTIGNVQELVWHLNSNLKMLCKVLIGFLPAFLTFYWTGDWWLLVYFGAVIWLGITGIRNILQAVLGGGGLRRVGNLCSWMDFFSWDRVADSLMNTGISVPLLDYVVKRVLLQRCFGWTAEEQPVAVFTGIALANGVYIVWHNLFRGFSRGVAVGNFFRSVFSVPVAIGFNAAIYGILSLCGVGGIAVILQQWAAIISKLASDCIAGVIEGYGDRVNNITVRLRDYQQKLKLIFHIYARLEVLVPEMEALALLENPRRLQKHLGPERHKLQRTIIVDALDLLYFWLYQPQARNALKRVMSGLTEEECKVLFGSVVVLTREREISRLFIDGLIGRHFSRALAFYLHHYRYYLKQMAELSGRPLPEIAGRKRIH